MKDRPNEFRDEDRVGPDRLDDSHQIRIRHGHRLSMFHRGFLLDASISALAVGVAARLVAGMDDGNTDAVDENTLFTSADDLQGALAELENAGYIAWSASGDMILLTEKIGGA